MTLSAIPVEFQAPSTGLLKSTDVENYVGSWLGNFFVSGFTPTAVSSSVQVVMGIAMLEGHYVSEASTYVIPFVASGTYVWLQLVRTGGAGTPVSGARYVATATTPLDAVVICSYADNGHSVTSVTDARQPAPILTSLQGGAAGDMYYATTAGELKRLAIGSAQQILSSSGTAPQWENSPGATLSRVTSDLPSINGTQSTGLAIALAANTNYIFRARLYGAYSNSSFMGYQIHALAAGAGFWLAGRVWGTSIGAGDIDPMTAVTTTFGNDESGAGSGVTGAVFVEGIVNVGSTPTTLQIDQISSSTSNTTKANSWLEVLAIA